MRTIGFKYRNRFVPATDSFPLILVLLASMTGAAPYETDQARRLANRRAFRRWMAASVPLVIVTVGTGWIILQQPQLLALTHTMGSFRWKAVVDARLANPKPAGKILIIERVISPGLDQCLG